MRERARGPVEFLVWTDDSANRMKNQDCGVRHHISFRMCMVWHASRLEEELGGRFESWQNTGRSCCIGRARNESVFQSRGYQEEKGIMRSQSHQRFKIYFHFLIDCALLWGSSCVVMIRGNWHVCHLRHSSLCGQTPLFELLWHTEWTFVITVILLC